MTFRRRGKKRRSLQESVSMGGLGIWRKLSYFINCVAALSDLTLIIIVELLVRGDVRAELCVATPPRIIGVNRSWRGS